MREHSHLVLSPLVGLAQVLDAARQVSGIAGDYQVDGVATFATLNFGGSTSTTVSFVVGSAS